MKNSKPSDPKGDEAIYSICVADIEDVAKELLTRPLTKKEIAAVKASVGDFIDWTQAIEHAIRQHVRNGFHSDNGF